MRGYVIRSIFKAETKRTFTEGLLRIFFTRRHPANAECRISSAWRFIERSRVTSRLIMRHASSPFLHQKALPRHQRGCSLEGSTCCHAIICLRDTATVTVRTHRMLQSQNSPATLLITHTELKESYTTFTTPPTFLSSIRGHASLNRRGILRYGHRGVLFMNEKEWETFALQHYHCLSRHRDKTQPHIHTTWQPQRHRHERLTLNGRRQTGTRHTPAFSFNVTSMRDSHTYPMIAASNVLEAGHAYQNYHCFLMSSGIVATYATTCLLIDACHFTPPATHERERHNTAIDMTFRLRIEPEGAMNTTHMEQLGHQHEWDWNISVMLSLLLHTWHRPWEGWSQERASLPPWEAARLSFTPSAAIREWVCCTELSLSCLKGILLPCCTGMREKCHGEVRHATERGDCHAINAEWEQPAEKAVLLMPESTKVCSSLFTAVITRENARHNADRPVNAGMSSRMASVGARKKAGHLRISPLLISPPRHMHISSHLSLVKAEYTCTKERKFPNHVFEIESSSENTETMFTHVYQPPCFHHQTQKAAGLNTITRSREWHHIINRAVTHAHVTSSHSSQGLIILDVTHEYQKGMENENVCHELNELEAGRLNEHIKG